MSIRIATTTSAEMHPLALGGQLVIDAAPSIIMQLRRTLSESHAALLADPENDPEHGETDWYTDVQGQVFTLADLQPAARAAVEQRLAGLTDDIKTLAEGLGQKAGAEDRRFGELLNLALNVPSPSCIKVVVDSQGRHQPVLVGWGHRPASAIGFPVPVQGFIHPLSRPAIVSPPPSGPVPPVEPLSSPLEDGMFILPPPVVTCWRWFLVESQPGWPLVLVALLLLIPVMWLLSMDVTLANRARMCRIDPAQIHSLRHFVQVTAERRHLDVELGQLEGQMGDARRKCRAPTGVNVPSPGGGA